MQPFVLTTEEIGKYDINYVGKEKLDEINCYKFSVKPKKLVKGERYFEGDIWVDDQRSADREDLRQRRRPAEAE